MIRSKPTCKCGCGQFVRYAEKTNNATGAVAGWPRDYVAGHNGVSGPAIPEWDVVDRGFKTSCWIWRKALSPGGYGRKHDAEKDVSMMAHRWTYVKYVGPIPEGLELDHLCRQRDCVNPDHLEPVTSAENKRRGLKAKLTVDDVLAIRARPDEKLQTLADEFGVGKEAIHKIRHRKRWKDV